MPETKYVLIKFIAPIDDHMLDKIAEVLASPITIPEVEEYHRAYYDNFGRLIRIDD